MMNPLLGYYHLRAHKAESRAISWRSRRMGEGGVEDGGECEGEGEGGRGGGMGGGGEGGGGGGGGGGVSSDVQPMKT